VLDYHAMKMYWGSESIEPCILDLDTRIEMSGQFHDPAALSPG